MVNNMKVQNEIKKTERKSNILSDATLIVGIIVIAITKGNAMDTLRLIAQTMLLIVIISCIYAIMKWSYDTLRKKE